MSAPRTARVVLVIDDDPTIGDFVRRALPDWVVHVAYNGADGIAFVRAHAEQLHLIILDYRMPHDGILVARQIREIHRTLPILPFSSVEEKSAAFEELGAAPLLSKRLGLAERELRDAAHAAAATTARPLPRWAVLADLQERADSSEMHQITGRAQTNTIAILASNRSTVQMLQYAAQEVGASVLTSATTSGALELFLRASPVQVIVSDGPCQRVALALRERFHMPIVVVALSVVAAFTANEAASGVLIDAEERELHAALETVARGARYRDTRLAVPLDAVGLNERERQILPLVLSSHTNEEIYRLLLQDEQGSLAEGTIRRYRATILEKFGVTTLAELIDRLTTWFHSPSLER